MTYTVKRLADLAGVSPRTLRFYDRIGLLKPDAVGANSYRKIMSKKQMFEPFTEEQQAAYAKEAEKRYDPEIVRASNRKWNANSPAEKKSIIDEGNAVYADIVAAIPKGAASPEVQACIARWHRHMEHFWSPNKAQLLGLAGTYNDSPDFRANFDKIDPRLAPFMREAVAIYVERMKK